MAMDSERGARTVRAMPVQKPGKSIQDYATPRVFLDAFEARWGKIDFDLAAHRRNAMARAYFTDDISDRQAFGIDALRQGPIWERLTDGRQFSRLWLNPPFGGIAPWAKRCAEWCARKHLVSPRLFFLVPASIGSNWFREHVHNQALVLFLSPRLSFDGKAPYPKDCMLCVYGESPGYECWRWTP